MNIAGLIGIAIAIVVGVSLIPTVTTTVNNLDTIDTPSTVLNLAELLPMRNIVAFAGNCNRISTLTRGMLNWFFQHANLELSGRLNLLKCVETIEVLPRTGNEMVQA